MGIIEGITATKAALEVSKLVTDLLNRPDFKVEDVRGRVNELLIHLVNAQVALGEAHVELADLRHKLDERESVRALNDDMDFQIDGGFYVRKSEAAKGLIAYCPICWTKEKQTVPLNTCGTPGWFRCSVHKTAYM